MGLAAIDNQIETVLKTVANGKKKVPRDGESLSLCGPEQIRAAPIDSI
jgi:hypothetical protein